MSPTAAAPTGFRRVRGCGSGGRSAGRREDITGLAPAGARARQGMGGHKRDRVEVASEPKNLQPSPEGVDYSMTTTGETQVTPDLRSS